MKAAGTDWYFAIAGADSVVNLKEALAPDSARRA